ncbi:TraR/DksA C4-type zinc finger protein [Patescibacteria group bacterium]|nr:TraR/DksA C4-type zinc finger protein [Patescibacteria group bacterium]
MDQEFIASAKKALEIKRADLEARLPQGATRFPDYGDDEESAVNEVEDYGANAGVAKDLLKDLQATKAALKRIDEGRYGICLKCGQRIEQKRLLAYPAAAVCFDCQK